MLPKNTTPIDLNYPDNAYLAQTKHTKYSRPQNDSIKNSKRRLREMQVVPYVIGKRSVDDQEYGKGNKSHMSRCCFELALYRINHGRNSFAPDVI